MNEVISYYRKKYFSREDVYFEMLKYMKNREFAVINREENWKCIRGLNPFIIKYFKDICHLYNLIDNDYNFYVSSGVFSYIPKVNLCLKKNDKEKLWIELRKNIIGFDLLIDFDLPKIETEYCFKDVVEEFVSFHRLLYMYNVTHICLFSGNNYHIIIPHEVLNYIPLTFTENTTQLNNYLKLGLAIKERFKLKFYDLKNLAVYNRLQKLPYSLVGDRVVLPLDDAYFSFPENMLINKDFFRVANIEKYYPTFRNRGIITYCDFGKEKNQQNIKKFFEENYIKWQN